MTDLPINLKHCPTCGGSKPTQEFSANKSRPDGLAAQCKSCVSAYQKIYRAEIKHKVEMYDRAQKVIAQKRAQNGA
jgi:hypothetical protein